MDKIDRKIIAELQMDGRLSATELAERIGLSLSPCHRRLRALEQSGAIRGYRAEINPALVGLTFSAIVFVTLREVSRDAIEAFEKALPRIPEITQAQRLFGDPDYILQMVTRDLASFQVLYDTTLTTLPNVQRLNSTLVMKDIIQNRPLPL